MTEDPGPAIAAATALRGQGLRCQIYGEQRKFKQKMSYADKLGVPFTAFLGEDEISEQKISVKDMETGEQRKMPLEEAASWMLEKKARLSNIAPIAEKHSEP